MEGQEIEHFSHEHPLFLNKELKIDGDHSEEMKCYGCVTPILGPFYSCKQCDFVLHKVCAELPEKMNHPIHSQHPLTLLAKNPYGDDHNPPWCDICQKEKLKQFVYYCDICSFHIDIMCASVTVMDKCHPHPLTILHTPITFYCHICRTEGKGVSYKCTICLFWVHQNCTLLARRVKVANHAHYLTLLPREQYHWELTCCICKTDIDVIGGAYACLGCNVYAHINCPPSETQCSRDQDGVLDKFHGQSPTALPLRQESRDLISSFVTNYITQDDRKEEKIRFSVHEHELFLLDGHTYKNICEACLQPISDPSYYCYECDFFLHKCCTELPINIRHPLWPHDNLFLCPPTHSSEYIHICKWCNNYSMGFCYIGLGWGGYNVDLNCVASLLKPVKHEAHQHNLDPIFLPEYTCSACSGKYFGPSLRCVPCNFHLCSICSMLPPIMNHRYDEHPFALTYSALENYHNEYFCELCEQDVNPNMWFYYCSLCDQFAHPKCLQQCAADSNIKYGKVYHNSQVHIHKLTLVPFTYNYSNCDICNTRLNIAFCAGFECAQCNFRVHLKCAIGDLKLPTLSPFLLSS